MEGPLFYKPQHADQRSLSCPWKRFHREEQSLRLSGHGRRTADAVRPTPVGRRSLRRTSRHAPPFFFLQLAPRRRSEGRSCVGRVGSAAAACRLCAATCSGRESTAEACREALPCGPINVPIYLAPYQGRCPGARAHRCCFISPQPRGAG